MYVADLWRYPVKSLGGERLEAVDVGPDGIAGDRRVLVLEADTGRIVTARRKPRLLGLHAALGLDGEPLVDGRPWADPASARAVIAAAGPSAHLVPWDGAERFDVLPLLVATDGAIAALGYDRRRLRPNIVVGGVPGLAERAWPGRRMRIGDLVLEFAKLRDRCVMTTYDPDSQVQDYGVLRKIVREFDGKVALDTAVVRGGRIALGDPAELLD